MKVKKGTSRIKMPPVGMMDTVSMVMKNGRWAVHLITNAEMDFHRKNKEHIEGMPTYCTYVEEKGGQYLLLWPKAPYAMEITIRFFPPTQEI